LNINKTTQISILYKSNMPNKTVPNKSKPTKEMAVSKDELYISNEAKLFQFAYQAIKDTPDIREDKVERIKNGIDAGTYNVDSEKVAEKIMASLFDIKL